MTKMWFIIELCLGLVLSLPYCVNTFSSHNSTAQFHRLKRKWAVTEWQSRSFHVRNYQNISANRKLSASANSQAERFFEIHETFFEIFETFFEEVESFFETFEDYLNHLMFIITIKLLWIQMVSRMMTWYILLTSYSFSRVFYWRNFSFYLLYIIIYNK